MIRDLGPAPGQHADAIQQAVDDWLGMERKARAYQWIVDNLQAGTLVFAGFTVDFEDITSGRFDEMIARAADEGITDR